MESSLLKCLPLLMFGGDVRSCTQGDDVRVGRYPALLIDNFYSMQCDQSQAQIIEVGYSKNM